MAAALPTGAARRSTRGRGIEKGDTMSKTTKIQSALVAALASVLFVAPVLRAQGAHAVLITGPGTKSEVLRQAEALFQQPAHWSEAAALLVAAAKRRDPGDPQRAQILATAARLYAYSGDTGRALYWMQKAGQQALDGGDVIVAAQTITQAALLAAAQRDWT